MILEKSSKLSIIPSLRVEHCSGWIPPPPVIFAYTRVMLLIFIIWVVCNGCFDAALSFSNLRLLVEHVRRWHSSRCREMIYNGNDVFVWLYPMDLARLFDAKNGRVAVHTKTILCSLTSDNNTKDSNVRLLALSAKLCETSNCRLLKCCTVRLDLHVVGRCRRQLDRHRYSNNYSASIWSDLP